MSALERTAMRLARPLLHEFYDSASFSYYGPLNTAVAERWIREDYGHVMDEVEHAGAMDRFRRSLEIYSRKLSAAGALANIFESGSIDDDNAETDTEEFFPGLLKQISSGIIERSDELPALVAILVDRLKCRASYLNYHASVVRPHSACRAIEWGFFDVEKIKGGPEHIAYLLSTRDAS